MVKLRLLLLLLTIFVVGTIGTATFLYAKGYRFDKDKGSLTPNGLFVIKSIPDGAQVFVNGELKSATNTTISLLPQTYDITVKKEGYTEWKKRLVIEKEIVTEATANLFKTTLSLISITNNGAYKPSISPDLSKIAYIVPEFDNEVESSGLWLLENINLPLGFSKDPRRITDGNLVDASFIWSPNGREILLVTPKGMFLLDIGKFTAQKDLVNIFQIKESIISKWELESTQKVNQQIKNLPLLLGEILRSKTKTVVFSPDEDLILYEASEDTQIEAELIKPFPGASTQKQERNIKKGQKYVYDIKEDRNFLIDTNSETQIVGDWKFNEVKENEPENSKRSLVWYPSSRQLILAEEGKITLMDYDGTNKQIVYSGSYLSPYVFPTQSLDKILILTNLGALDKVANLYSLNIK